jgi:hypothetical protein
MDYQEQNTREDETLIDYRIDDNDTYPLLQDDADYYTIAELKRRGWTGTLIRDYLGKPDQYGYVDKEFFNIPDNVRPWSCLYLIERVNEAEATTEFQQQKEHMQNRGKVITQNQEKRRSCIQTAVDVFLRTQPSEIAFQAYVESLFGRPMSKALSLRCVPAWISGATYRKLRRYANSLQGE